MAETLTHPDRAAALAPAAAPAIPPLANRVFWASLAVTALVTLAWLYFVWTGREGGVLFRGYQVDAQAIVRVLVGFLVTTVLWGWLWYGIKRLLLRRLAGLSREEIDMRSSRAWERRSTCGRCCRGTPSAGSASPTWWAAAAAS